MYGHDGDAPADEQIGAALAASAADDRASAIRMLGSLVTALCLVRGTTRATLRKARLPQHQMKELGPAVDSALSAREWPDKMSARLFNPDQDDASLPDRLQQPWREGRTRPLLFHRLGQRHPGAALDLVDLDKLRVEVAGLEGLFVVEHR